MNEAGTMLIGREQQLREVIHRIEEMIAGRREQNVLFITGEAGIGKSAFLAAVQESCTQLQFPPLVSTAACSTPLAGTDIGEVEALQPWAELLRRLATGTADEKKTTRKLVANLAMAWIHCIPVIGDVLESVADTAQIVSDYTHNHETVTAVNQQQVFQQYINVLEKLSEKIPVVLMLDDVHWADTSSVNLLFTAARQLQQKPILFIIAYRPDDASSSRNGEGHPILHIRNELERYALTDEIEITQLTHDDVGTLLHARYPQYHHNDRFEAWLTTMSGGNALFVTQFLKTLEEDGHIDRDTGSIDSNYQKTTVPPSAYAVVQERIRRLTEETRELLRYASVEGDTFTSAVLATLTELPQLKLLQRLRLAEETHHIVQSLGRQQVYTTETGAYRFKHALLHRAMYESLNEEERVLLHEMIFDALQKEWEIARQTSSNLDRITARLAVHAEVLGNYLFAAEMMIAAAQWHQHRYTYDEARLAAQSALDLLHNADDTEERSHRRAEAYAVRAAISQLTGHHREALEDYRLTAELAQSLDSKLWVMAMNGQATEHFWLGDNTTAEQLAQRALDESQARNYPDQEHDALIRLAHIQIRASNAPLALEILRNALHIAEHLGPSAEAQALNDMGMIYRSLGQYEDATRCYQQSLERIKTYGDPTNEATALNNLANIAAKTNQTAQARNYLIEAIALCRRIGDSWTEAYCENNLGVINSSEGELEEAMKHFLRSRELNHAANDIDSEAIAVFNLGDTEQALGHYAAAEDYYRQSLTLYEQVKDLDGCAYVYGGLGSVALKQQHLEDANLWYKRSLELASEVETRALALTGLGEVGLAQARTLPSQNNDSILASAIEHLEQGLALFEQTNAQSAQQCAELLKQARAVADNVHNHQ